MFKAIGHEKKVLIVLLVFILLVNTTNLTFPNAVDEKTIKDWSNTAEASSEKDCSSISEPDDDFYCKEFDWGAFSPDRQIVDELCDASEDYAKNPKNCDKAYELIEEKDLREDKEVKEVCDEVGGEMKKDGCHTDHDGPMADKFEELMTERNQQEVKPKLLVPSLLKGTLTEEQKEALSKENPNWEFKSDVNIPNSLEGKLTQEQSEPLSEDNYDIEYQWEDTASNPVPGTPSYVEPDEVEDSPPPVIEDWGNTVTDEEQEKINAAAQYQQTKHEQLADSNTNPGKIVEQILQEEQEQEVSEQEEEEIAEYNEDDNQANTDTEDSSDNTDSSDSEDNSSDDGGDSSDSGDDSSSSDDGGDSGDSSESEE